MSLYHSDVRYFSRRRGQAVVAAAAYRRGQKFYDHYYGELHNFTRKCGIVHTMVLLPEDAPPEYSDRETLWNAVEHAEKRRDARLAREVEAALQTEFSLDENIRLVREYVIANFVDKGMIADVSIENKDGNPHFHCLLTTRNVNPDGFGKKNRDWDKRECLEQWRLEWANIQNRKLERKGFNPISHECYAVQDLRRSIERRPTIHLGHYVQKLDLIGIETDRMGEYREIVEHNHREQERQQEHQRRSHGRERQ